LSRIGDVFEMKMFNEVLGEYVTEIYDLSEAPEWLHEATKECEDWRSAVEASLANLAELVERAD
jgi:hypothetical protein